MDTAKIKILVVDDDIALLGVMEESLKLDVRCQVCVTASSTEALRLLKTGAYDIVVTDFDLGDPEINGLDILRVTRGLHKPALGIIVTGFASLKISIEAIRLGAYDFLTKPFQIDELQLTVRNAMEKVDMAVENNYLQEQVAELAETIYHINGDHATLLKQLKTFQERSEQLTRIGKPTTAASIAGRVENYMKVGRTIGEKLEGETRRLEMLFEKGLIPEPAYRKGIEKREREAPR